MRYVHTHQQGYIALIALLIISAVTLAIALTLNGLSITETDTGLLRQQSVQAEQAAYSCLQEAYVRLMNDAGYTGGTTLTLGTASCQVTSVVAVPPSDVAVTIMGISGSVQREFTGTVARSAGGLTPGSWQEND